MNIKDPRHDVPIWNSGCAALMCISFAALLAEACMVQMAAPPRSHWVCALLYAAQATAVYRSILPYRIGAPRMSGPGWRARRITAADLATALVLAGLGYAGSAWLSTSTAQPAALFAVLLCLVPWWRIPLCRTRLPLAAAMLLLGGAAPLLAGKLVGPPLSLLVPAWVLWLAASVAWLRLILLKWRKSRAMAGYPASG